MLVLYEINIGSWRPTRDVDHWHTRELRQLCPGFSSQSYLMLTPLCTELAGFGSSRHISVLYVTWLFPGFLFIFLSKNANWL